MVRHLMQLIAQLSRRCARMPVVLFFSVANLTLLALIVGEYSSPSPVRDALLYQAEQHGGLANLSIPLLHNRTSVSPLRPQHSQGGTLFELHPLNSTDPVTHRRVIAEIFSPKAYYNVNLENLNRLANKALETNAAQCDNITTDWARAEANKTGLALCSCQPDTLGK